MKKTSKLEAKKEESGVTYFILEGQEYQLGSKSSPYADRVEIGDEVEYEFAGKMISFFKKVGDSKSGSNFLGDDYVTHKELLTEAHKQFKELSITSELLEFDWDNQRAIVRAEVKTSKGTFSGLGDCSPENTPSKNIATAFVRMSETRAVNRALRFACNIGKTSKEELPENHDVEEIDVGEK